MIKSLKEMNIKTILKTESNLMDEKTINVAGEGISNIGGWEAGGWITVGSDVRE